MVHIKHGFQGQRMIILPVFIIDNMANNPMMNDLFIHSLGYFPKAKYHHIDRPAGCAENILIYCSKGKGWIRYKEEIFELTENQFIIISAQTPHSYGANEEDPWTIYWIHFKGYKSPLFEKLYNKTLSIVPQNNSRIEDRINLFEEMYKALNDSFEIEALHYANLCLGYFLGTILYINTYRNSKESRKYGTSLINLATHYMNENIDKKMKLDDIARHFGYSTSYFYRLFYKSVGYSPMDYFNQLKIYRSCYYLLSSPRRINEISLSVGIDDPYYFSRLFKKIMGVSPSKYRSMNKHSQATI